MSSTTGGASRAVWMLLITALCLTGCPPTGEPPPFAPVGEGGAGGADPACVDRDGDGFVEGDGCALPAGDCAPDDATRNPRAIEVCNLIDDNCNRDTDEGNPGGGVACDTGLDGICAAGTTACMQGALACVQSEEREPRETCNGEDDDCDGAVDEENPGGGARCDSGLDGRCAQGTETCFDGSISCVPDDGAAAERCNGEDDDCDGAVDEENPGGGSDCGTDLLGECAAGAEICENGGLICQGTFERRDELCDRRDDDCDGRTDEAFADLGEPCTQGEGVCLREGVRVCAPDGAGTICGIDPGDAIEELCNGQDDDCDGRVDEAYADLDSACTVGVGACEVAGVRICDDDGRGTICGAEPGSPVAETCNGVDDDCDGEADNGFELGVDCRGADQCASPGTTICADDGAAVVCDVPVVVQPAPETCDGTDDDCDGAVDEAFATLGDPCQNGLGVCERAGVFVCAPDGAAVICDAQPGAPLDAELCNATDDDCDGRVDNGAPCPGDPGMRVTTVRIAEFGAIDCGRDFTGDGAPDNALGSVAGLFNPLLAEAFGPDGARGILMRFLGGDGDAPVTLELLEAVRTAGGLAPSPRVIDAFGAGLERLPGLIPGDRIANPEPGLALSVPSPLFSTQAPDPAWAAASFLPMQRVVFDGDRQGLQVPTAQISGLVDRQALIDAYAAAALACADAVNPPPACATFDAFSAADLDANLAADADLDGTPAVSVCLILGAEPVETLPVGGQPCDDDSACFVGLVCRAAPVTGDPALGAALEARCGPPGVGGLDDGAICGRDADCVHGLCAAAVAGGKRCASLCAADDDCAAGVCRGVRVDLPDALTPGGLTAGICLEVPGSGAACDTDCAGAEICGPWFAGGLATPGVEVRVEGRCQAVDPAGAALGETCADAFDCAHGNGCVQDLEGVLRCAAPCVAADGCSDGKICAPRVALPAIGAADPLIHGACLRVPPSVGSGVPCTADRDCLGEEICRAEALPGGDVTRYCARGEGFFTVGQPCVDAGQCASGRCLGGICGGLCDDDVDCGSRLFCVADGRVDAGVVLGGECQAPDARCVRDIDCNAAPGCAQGRCICDANQCVRGCRFPAACADGLHCREDNVCAPFCRDDEAEPNDTLGQATRLPLGRRAARVEQIAQLCDGSAVDWYSATAPGLPFRFVVDALTEGVTLDVALIDAFGNPLAEASATPDGLVLLIDDPVDVAALSGQLVFLIVRGSGVEGGAEYRLIGELQAPDCPDPAVEPRDEPWEFTELLADPAVDASERVDAWICPQDTDWYTVSLQGGDRLTVDVEVLGNAVELPDTLTVQLEGPDHTLVGTSAVLGSIPGGTGQIVFDMPAIECIDSFCHINGVRTRVFCSNVPSLCSSMPYMVRVAGTEANTQAAYTLDASIVRADAGLRCVPDPFEPDIVFDDPDRFQAIVGPQSVETVPNLPGVLTFPYYQWQTMDARACGGDGGVALATDLDRVLMFLQPGDRVELDLSQDGAQRLQIDWYAQQADNTIEQQEFEVSVQPVYRTIFDPQFGGEAPFGNGRYYGLGIVRGGNDGGAYQYSVPYTARFRRLPADFVPDLDCAAPFTANLVFGQDNKAGDTRGARDDHRPGLCAGGEGADHVYRAVTPAGGPGTLVATVTAAGGEGDFGVSVRTVCDAVNTEVECNEDDLGAINPRERAQVRARLDGGRPVFIIVDSFSPAHEGPYTLTVRWEADAR